MHAGWAGEIENEAEQNDGQEIGEECPFRFVAVACKCFKKPRCDAYRTRSYIGRLSFEVGLPCVRKIGLPGSSLALAWRQHLPICTSTLLNKAKQDAFLPSPQRLPVSSDLSPSVP